MRFEPRFLPAALLLVLAVGLAVFMRVEAAQRVATGEASTCRINETLDCDRVQSSAGGSFLGVSTSTWGAAGNLIALAWLLAARRRPGLLPLAGLLVVANALVGLFMFWVSWRRIGAFCLYCAILQALMLAVAALVAPAAWRAFRERFARVEGRSVGFGAATAALVLALFVAGDAYAAQRADFFNLTRPYEGKATLVDLADRLVLGDPEAPDTVVVYFCFGCPNCRLCYHRARAALEDPAVRRQVHFVFKHFLLDRECNEQRESGPNRRSCRASRAAQAAAGHSKGPQAMAYLFGLKDRYEEFTNLNLDAMSRELDLGLTEEEWDAARAAPRVRAVIRRDVAEGNAMGLVGVPQVYLNGRRIRSKDLVSTVKRRAGSR